MKKILALFCIIACSAAIFACNKSKGTSAPPPLGSGTTPPQATSATQGAEMPTDTENKKYDKNGNLIYKKHTLDSGKTEKEEFFTYSEESELLSHEVLEYKYDSQGNLVSRVSSDILGGEEEAIIFEQKYSYNSQNRVTEEEFRILGKSGELFLYNKIALAYDGEGTLTRKASLFYGENASLFEGHFWEYDGNGKQTSFCKETYFCSADGNSEQIRGESIDEKGEIKFTYTTLIEYGEDGRTALETRRECSKDGEILSKKSVRFEYDESGNATKVTEKEFIGESLPARVTVTATEYGESGKTVTKEETVYNSENTASSTLSVSKYDKNGKLSEL